MYNVHVHVYVSIHVGTKNVWKQMLKISQGRVRDRGVTWFPELVDKSQCIHHAMTVCVYAMCRKEYKDAPLLGDEELPRFCR